MKARKTRQFLSAIMALVMVFCCLITPATATSEKVNPVSLYPEETPEVQTQNATDGAANGGVYPVGEGGEAIDPNAEVRILVRLDGTPEYLNSGDLEKAVRAATTLKAAQVKAENRIEAKLNRQIEVENHFTLLFNGFSFTGEYWMLEAINALDGLTATIPAQFALIEAEETDALTPSMSTSTGLSGATGAWELGYTGEGVAVAVVDTGILSTHEAFSVMPENGKIDMAYLEKVYEQYGEQMHANGDLEEIYENEKLPFNWDYFDYDAIPNHTASDHGTHVAGIAAGNNGADFKGVAPDAQIVTMQVFADDGGAYWDTILCALEDCVYLGVDAINMSLGSAAGFTAYESTVDGFAEVYAALENAGISVAVAAGNDGTTLVWTSYGDWFYSIYQGLAANPDVGLVSSPATLPGSFGVGSVVNTDASGYLTAYGVAYYFGTIAGQPALGELEGEQDVVYVGLGSLEEIEAAGGVEGKIALIQCGTLTFTEKCSNAAAAGAVGVLMFNNASGIFSPSVESSIPFGTLSMEEGLEILANFADGVNGKITIMNEFDALSVNMARDSSWGTTADLRISPDISAPGDGITSSVGFYDDYSYETWSGTSMATPHVAAGLSVIKQHVRTLFPNATAKEVNELAYAFAMSTAHQVSGFVRQQGAGLMDVAAAVSTEVYLSVSDNSRPKLEMDESEDGTFSFSFTVNNAGTAEHTYTVVPSVLTEKVFESEYSGTYYIQNPETTTVKLINGTVYDVTDLCNITAPETVTVKAGESVTVEMTIACSEELMAYFEENCPSGMFLEGFIHLEETGADPIDLSIPFLGFVGDWDYASMLDRGYYWQEPTGENNYQQLTTSDANSVGYMTDQVLGLNRYADMTGKTYLSDRNAISPNGDGVMDALTYIEFTLLRNPKTVKLYVADASGNVVETLYEAGDYTYHKDYFSGSFNGGNTFSNIIFEYAAEELAENETAYLVLETWLDHEGYDPANNESGRWVIPVTKDLTAPAVKVVDGGIEILDANYTAYYAVYADEAKTELLYETGVFAETRGVAEFYETDVATLYVVTADYAGNEQFYLVENGAVIELDTAAFYNGRTIIGMRSKNYVTGYYDFDWVSFQSELPGTVTDLNVMPEDYMPEDYDIDLLGAAVSFDGTVYANDFDTLYTLNPETLERTKVAEFSLPGVTGLYYHIRNITVDPGTGQMYASGDTYDPETWENTYALFSLDVETGELTEVFQYDLNQYDVWAVTFVGDGLLALFNSASNDILTLDLEGNIVSYYSLGLYEPTHGASDLGIFGYSGNMIYDPNTNAVYMSSDWSWFFHDRYSQGGMVKFDFDTETATMSLIGNYGGMVVHSMFFADEAAPVESVELTDFTLDQTAMDLQVGENASVYVITEPENANGYSIEWISSDEGVVTVAGGPNKANLYSNSDGTATVTATAYDGEGNEIASKSVEVTVSYDEELLKALNVEGGNLKFLTSDPYPFVPVEDEATGRYYAVSTNAGVMGDYNYSVLTMTMDLNVGDKISFDYFVSSEEHYDLFGFLVNGETELIATGEVDWTNYTYAVAADGTYTLEWVYQKDFSVDVGLDVAGVDNVELIPSKLDDVIAMIDAIGEVTMDSGDVIAAARDAYEGLSDAEKALVENYQTLLDAERAYVALLAEYAALYEAKYYALDIVTRMEATDTSGYCAYQLKVFESAVAAAKEAIEAAATAEEIDAALEALYAAIDDVACYSAQFTDVNPNAWYHESVDYVLDHGYMVGVSTTEFAPNAQLTRAQIVTILYRIADEPSVEGLDNPFTDVAEGKWYTDAVVWAFNNNIVAGIDDKTFAPNAVATREQFVSILYRYHGEVEVDTSVLDSFKDAGSVSKYAVDAMAWAVEEGIISGMSSTTLAPKGTATRAQIASIMMRYLEA